MSLHSFFEEEDAPAHVDLSPLIDMVFLLLLYFMVATTMDQSEGITVRKAEARTAAPLDRDKFKILLDSNGTAWLGNQSVNIEQALQSAVAWHRQEPEGTILIVPDKRSPMEPFIFLMDRLKLEGVRSLAIGTQPVPKHP